MVFRRRNPLTWRQWLAQSFWPRGGWGRALLYLNHRLRRLPDPPHRIARGVFAGIWATFTPFFGVHFVIAAGLAWAIRGNLLAALIATLIGNPLTFPFIAVLSVELGNWMLGHGGEMGAMQIFTALGQAGAELSANFWAIFTPETASWDRMGVFLDRVFWPYLLGGAGPGFLLALAGYRLTLPVVTAYQKMRSRRLAERFERQRALREAARRATAGDGEGGDA